MKVSILGSRGIPAGYGAFEVCAYQLGLGLTEMGCEVTVYCPHSQSYQERDYQGIQLVHIYHPPGPFGSLAYDGLSLIRSCFQESDVILVLGYSSSPFCLFPRLFGKKVVINTDGLEWRRSKWGSIPKLWLRLTERIGPWVADRLVSDSVAIKDYYKGEYGADSVFIPYGTEFPSLDNLPDPNRSSYYIVVMRMEPENSILEIVEGFRKSLIEKELVIVGPSTPFFQEKVLPLVDTDLRISYLGPIYDREKLFTLRSGAFAYLHGHTVGGTNPSLLEAMASGNLVIARDVPFNREVLGDSGFYFDTVSDLKTVLETIEDLSTECLDLMRETSYQIVSDNYTWKGVIRDYYSLFCEVARCKPN